MLTAQIRDSVGVKGASDQGLHAKDILSVHCPFGGGQITTCWRGTDGRSRDLSRVMPFLVVIEGLWDTPDSVRAVVRVYPGPLLQHEAPLGLTGPGGVVPISPATRSDNLRDT